MEKENIVLVNAHWSNHGDEAAIFAIVGEILKHKPDAAISLIIKDKKEVVPELMIHNHKVSCVSNQFLPKVFDYFVQLRSNGKHGKNLAMKRYIEMLKEADYIFYAPGGSVINDRFWWRKQLEYMLPLWYAKRYKKPIYVASPSMGPFEAKHKIRNFIRRRIFSGTKFLYVREEMSYEYLKKIGAEKTAKVTIDSAFCSEVHIKEQEKVYEADEGLTAFMKHYQRVVGVTITELDWNVKFLGQNMGEKIVGEMRDFLSFLCREGIGVVLIPQLFGNQNDKSLLEKYSNNIENTFILNPEYSADFQQYLISKLYMVIGMRYHSNIFSAKMGVPFLPVMYEEKMESFVKEAGLEPYAVYVEDISADALCKKFLKIEDEYEEYKSKLSELKAYWEKRAEVTKESIKEFFTKRS